MPTSSKVPRGTRYVHLNVEAVETLRANDFLDDLAGGFPSENPGSHLDPRHFYARIFLPTVKRLGFEGVTWHTLRHTFASSHGGGDGAGYFGLSGALHDGVSEALRAAQSLPSERYRGTGLDLCRGTNGVEARGEPRKRSPNGRWFSRQFNFNWNRDKTEII